MTTTNRSDTPIGEHDLDADLIRSVKHASFMRQGFYVVVLLVALAGQVSGAVEALHIPLIWAIPAVGALELGGIVVLTNADVRRRLGERAVASRLLSVIIAAWAVAFNWLAHKDHLLGGFFAGMSALGYLVWLMHTENQRRDRLRAKGDLPPTTPAYETFGHWLRHPLLTMRAKSLAKAQPHLGLYDSLAEARADVRSERRTSAISKVLHRKIRAAVDPTTADIAVAVYDLDQIATRLADGADYDGLTALIATDLAPARLTAEGQLPAADPTNPERDTVDLDTHDLDLEFLTVGVEERLSELTKAVEERDATIGDLRDEVAAVLDEVRRLAPLASEVVELRRNIAHLQTQRAERPREERRVPAPRKSQRRDGQESRQGGGSDETSADRDRTVAEVIHQNQGVTAKELDALIAKRLKVSERTARRAREAYQRGQQTGSPEAAQPDEDPNEPVQSQPPFAPDQDEPRPPHLDDDEDDSVEYQPVRILAPVA